MSSRFPVRGSFLGPGGSGSLDLLRLQRRPKYNSAEQAKVNHLEALIVKCGGGTAIVECCKSVLVVILYYADFSECHCGRDSDDRITLEWLEWVHVLLPNLAISCAGAFKLRSTVIGSDPDAITCRKNRFWQICTSKGYIQAYKSVRFEGGL